MGARRGRLHFTFRIAHVVAPGDGRYPLRVMSTLSDSISPVRYDRTQPAEPTLSRDAPWLQQAKGLVADLYERSPAIYWTDFLVSVSVAWALTFIVFTADAPAVVLAVAFFGASILFFRAGTFIHELVHLQPGQMTWFGRAWNLLMGIPLLMPWIMYRNHVDHHSAKHFGTPGDGEYLPLASSPLGETLKYMVQAPALPLYMIVRFGILTPVSYLHPKLREFVLTCTSAAGSNPYYRKRFPKRDESHLQIVEALCFLYIATIAVLVWHHVIPLRDLGLGYALLAFTLALNWFRNLAAHRYGNRGERMTHVEQFADSINITGQTWLTMLLFPVGLRYHALHHLFPSLPYHNLGKAHRRLTESLPADAPYHATGRESFLEAVAELWNSARQTPPEDSAMRRWHGKSGAA